MDDAYAQRKFMRKLSSNRRVSSMRNMMQEQEAQKIDLNLKKQATASLFDTQGPN